MADQIPRRLQGALLRIRGDHPFFGALALFAEIRVDESVTTAATDGKILWFNANFVELQDTSQLCGLVAHELLHAALLHGLRRGERDSVLWNIAADIVVNGMVRKDTSYALPLGGVEDATLAHLSVEEIYEQLQGGTRPIPGIALLDLRHPGFTNGGPTAALGRGGAIDHAQAAELERHWRSALQQAAAVAHRIGRGIGKDGLDAVRDIGEAISPSLNWREVLWQFMVATPHDFAGFDRRFIHRRLYLEEMVGESVDVAIVLDTSGSISGPVLDAFMGEIQGILDAYPQIRGQLFFADAALYGPHEFSRDATIPPPQGGGGTSFVPLFDWVAEQERQGSTPLCIYFTDGYGTFPRQPPAASLLWVVTHGGLESEKFPFGQVVRIANHG